MQLPAIGSFFEGRYQIEALLGEGGFGVVYRALDTGATRPVALKILSPVEGSYAPQRRARFEREIRLVAQLRDPHTVRLFDYGQSADGLLFMVFELVDGRDLAEHLAEVGPLPAAAVRHILVQVLQALREAHHVGLIHRDIKPQNIRVFESMGDPLCAKLLDFGIAKPTDPTAEARLTQTGALIGTPRYMSPEQLRAEPLTPASDIYSLGVVAFEMLMGERAMHGVEVGDQLRRLVDSQALHLPESHEAELRHVVHHMLARDPRARFQSADDVLHALRSSAANPQPDRPPTPHRPAPPPPDPSVNRWLPYALGATGVAALAVGLVLASRDAPPRTAPAGPSVRRAPTIVVGAAATSGSNSRPVATAEAPPGADVGAPTSSSGCGQAPPFIGRDRVTSNGGRTVTLVIPRDYDPDVAHPVVLMFHDQGLTDKAVVQDSGFEAVADRGGFIVAAPRDRMDITAFRPDWSDQADLAAGRDVLRTLDKSLCIDHDRIFAVGDGSGGDFVERLRCHMPELRAIATNAYRSSGELGCRPQAPIPYIHFTGRDNGHLPVRGGTGCSGPVFSLAEHDALWREQNGCGPEPQVWLREGKSRCVTFQCATPYVSCELDGGRGFDAQRDPRGADFQRCDGDPPTFRIAAAMWRFFEQVTADGATAR